MKIPNFFKLFSRKQEKQVSTPSSVVAELSRALYPYLSGTDFWAAVSEGYLGNSTVFRCIKMIAEGAATIPWLLYRRGETMEEIYEHPAKDLLQRPNPRVGFTRFIHNLITYLYLDGNAYVLAVGPERKPPKELHLLRPDAVEVRTQDDDVEYRYRTPRGERILPAEKLLHLRFFSPIDENKGASPISPIALFIDHKNAGVRWNLSLLLNGARPGGALIHPRQLTEEQRKTLKMVIDEYVGAGNAGKILLLTGEFDFKEMGMKSQDLDWLNGIKLDTREIALTLGVPPQLVGDSENLTYSNYQEARRSLYQETIIPLVNFIVSEVNIWLLNGLFGEKDLFFQPDLDQIEALRESRKELWELALQGVSKGVITINEARELLGYERYESRDADMIYIPLSVVPITPEPASKAIRQKKFYLLEPQIEQKWEEKRRRVWDPWERKWVEALQKVFKEQEDDVLKALGAKQVTFNEVDWDKRLAQIAIPLLDSIVREGFEDAKGDLGIDVDYEQHRGRVYSWIEKEAGTKIKGINDTTIKAIREQLEEGIRNGEGIPELSKRVKEVFEFASKTRAKTIARTETLRAYRHGNLEVYDAAGVSQGQWWTARDERTCEECMGLRANFPP